MYFFLRQTAVVIVTISITTNTVMLEETAIIVFSWVEPFLSHFSPMYHQLSPAGHLESKRTNAWLHLKIEGMKRLPKILHIWCTVSISQIIPRLHIWIDCALSSASHCFTGHLFCKTKTAFAGKPKLQPILFYFILFFIFFRLGHSWSTELLLHNGLLLLPTDKPCGSLSALICFLFL